MSGKKVGQLAVNWIALGSRIPAAVRGDFNAFRNRHEAIKSSLLTTKETPDPIDWDFYKKSIKKAGLVEKLESFMKATTVPFPEDTQSVKIAADRSEIEAEVEAAIKESKANAMDLQKQLDDILSEKPFEEMTVDDYLQQHPEFEKEIREKFIPGAIQKVRTPKTSALYQQPTTPTLIAGTQPPGSRKRALTF